MYSLINNNNPVHGYESNLSWAVTDFKTTKICNLSLKKSLSVFI